MRMAGGRASGEEDLQSSSQVTRYDDTTAFSRKSRSLNGKKSARGRLLMMYILPGCIQRHTSAGGRCIFCHRFCLYIEALRWFNEASANRCCFEAFLSLRLKQTNRFTTLWFYLFIIICLGGRGGCEWYIRGEATTSDTQAVYLQSVSSGTPCDA